MSRINDAERTWRIPPTGVHGGPNKTQLIDCSLIRNKLTGDYMFVGPLPDGSPLTSVKSPIAFPFWFPKFTSSLNGKVRRNWYIRVDYVDGGPDHNQAHGQWRNTAPPPHDDDDITDTDTWTTQAGVGAEPEGDKKNKNKKAAASASAKQ